MSKLWPTPRAYEGGAYYDEAGNAKESGLKQAVKMRGSSPEDSHVKTSPLRVRERESGASGPVFGLRCIELLAKYDPALQLWRTLERSLFEDLPMFVDRLPRSGMMRNGKIYEQATWVRRTEGNESGSWLTPAAMELDNQNAVYDRAAKSMPGRSLTMYARMKEEATGQLGNWATEPTIRGVADGISDELDAYQGRLAHKSFKRVDRLRGLGNSIIPQIACLLFRQIMEADRCLNTSNEK